MGMISRVERSMSKLSISCTGATTNIRSITVMTAVISEPLAA